ncbi:hypothetical protein COTS27_00819 [Spirochaetota bacterium]|nr:hypothetical protein COTS27_00819 [Spirochaetota bacterium]
MHSEPKISSSEKNSFLKRVRDWGKEKWRVIDWGKIFTVIPSGILFVLVIILVITIYFIDAPSNKEVMCHVLLRNLGIANDKNCDIGLAIERLGIAIGGIIALLVALASFQRAKALDDTAKAQEQGNIEDRYKNAITQFGNANSSVRLAGAYGLYHLAIDNEKRRKNICDVLCVHIRDLTTSGRPIFNEKKDLATTVGHICDEKSYSEKYENKPSNEVQSILDLLTNKSNEKNFPFKSHWINLANSYLNGANLDYAWLKGADLEGVQFQGVILRQAQLQGTNLKKAQLQGAVLSEAQLQGANLSEAQLQAANLFSAELQGAILSEAQLQGTNLKKAQLQGAFLPKAQLQAANLKEAWLQATILWKAELQGAFLPKAQLQAANLFSAELQGAILEETNFSGVFTEEDIEKYFYIDIAIKQLKDRTNKEAYIENAIFSGSAAFNGSAARKKSMEIKLKNLQKVITETVKKLSKIIDYPKYMIQDFVADMNNAYYIIQSNMNDAPDSDFPKEYAANIKDGNYPEAEARKVIEMLERVKKEFKE